MPSQHLTNAATAELEPAGLPALDGAGVVATGRLPLPGIAGADVGIWSIAEGTVRGVTKDEVFVVLSGRATVEFHDTGEVLHIGPGDAVRLHRGQENTWTTHEALRKIYVNQV